MDEPVMTTGATRVPRKEAGRATMKRDGGLMRALVDRMFEPVDIAWLAAFRVVFGMVMFVEVWRYFAHGWVDSHFAAERFHFTYHFFEWVRPWPAPFMHVHFAVLGLLALCLAAGFCYRVAAALFFVGFTQVFLVDEVYYLNHFYLICQVSLLLVFLPAHREWSVDCRLRPGLHSTVAPAWTLWLMRAQILTNP
jgi:hypothetical protein